MFLINFNILFIKYFRLVRLLNYGSKESRSFLGGFIAGSALILIPNAELRISVAVFFLMRAFEAIFKHAILNKFLPLLPHSELILMSLASSQVVFQIIFA